MEVDLGRRQPMDGKPRARLRTGRGHGTRGHDGHALAAIGRRGGAMASYGQGARCGAIGVAFGRSVGVLTWVPVLGSVSKGYRGVPRGDEWWCRAVSSGVQ